jgi:aspartyl-tRNA(Asn)/glutamyl-tRNA(Gln) amidotransferase subunit C
MSGGTPAVSLDIAQVRHVAGLARLALDDAELEALTPQLAGILTYAQQVGEVAADDAEVEVQQTAEERALRRELREQRAAEEAEAKRLEREREHRERIAEQLDEKMPLDEAEARGTSSAIEPRLFAARSAALAALALFLKTVQAVYPQDGGQAVREARASLLQPWLGFWGEYRKKARTSGSADLDIVVEPGDSDAGDGGDAPDAV